MCVLIHQSPKDSTPPVMKKTPLDFQSFPINHACPKMLGGQSLRLGIPTERLSIPARISEKRNNAGWLVTWYCPLRTDSASRKSLEPFMQLISFCNSWIQALSSIIVFGSSDNFLLEIVSKVDPWNRFNSSISLRLFSWASRRSQILLQ